MTKGWHGESQRHSLARRGIKTVSLSKAQRDKVKRMLAPLERKKLVKRWELIEDFKPRRTKKYQLVYSDDTVRKHRDIILSELERRGLNYYLLPKEVFGIKRRKEYQLEVDVNGKELQDLTDWMYEKITRRSEVLQFFEGTIDPTMSFHEVLPLKGAEDVPDLRIRNRKRFPNFGSAKKIIKPVDKDTNLVIISTRPKKSKAIRKALKGERVKDILVQDFRPKSHSQKLNG